MIKKVQIKSKVVDGNLTRNRKFLVNCLKDHEGKEIVITIERKRKKHSDLQRGYYFGVIVSLIREAIFIEWGEKMDSNEVHELLKTNCNWKEQANKRTGEIIRVAGSIKQHTTSEQEEFHEDCRRWAKEWFNIDIPLPNEQIEIQVD
jgi:hypothetical protein